MQQTPIQMIREGFATLGTKQTLLVLSECLAAQAIDFEEQDDGWRADTSQFLAQSLGLLAEHAEGLGEERPLPGDADSLRDALQRLATWLIAPSLDEATLQEMKKLADAALTCSNCAIDRSENEKGGRESFLTTPVTCSECRIVTLTYRADQWEAIWNEMNPRSWDGGVFAYLRERIEKAIADTLKWDDLITLEFTEQEHESFGECIAFASVTPCMSPDLKGQQN